MKKQLFSAILFGIIFVVIGFLANRNINEHKKYCTEEVSATVVNYLENIENTVSDDSDTRIYETDITYTPVFSYEYNGNTYTATAGNYGKNYREKFPLSSTYNIKINPNDPEMIYIKDIVGDNIGYLFMVIGSLVFIFSLVSLVRKSI